MNTYKILIILFILPYLVFGEFGGYSCRDVNDCVVNCLNIPKQFIYNLQNISSDWFPVLQDNGNCYLHNKITGENQLF